MISNRLKSLAKYINNNDKVIDIGCDHALLDIYLIKNNFLDHLIVSDIHEGALNSGIINIKKESLDDKIDARLGNGLEVLEKNDTVDTVLISGMGTNTILKILDNDYLKKVNKIIIQSNNDHYLLRQNICDMGFLIYDEECIYDNNKFYINIVFIRGNNEYDNIDLKYGPILKITGKSYYKYYRENLKNIMENIPDGNVSKKELSEKIKELDDVIFDI